MAPSDRKTPGGSGGSDREKALDTALAQIERQFGKGSVMRLGQEGRAPVEVIPTGSIALDIALGIGGLPRGRVIEIYGPESSGKTTLALHAIANAQKAGGIAAIIDAEHALDPEYAKNLGVDIDALLVSQPDESFAPVAKVEVGPEDNRFEFYEGGKAIQQLTVWKATVDSIPIGFRDDVTVVADAGRGGEGAQGQPDPEPGGRCGNLHGSNHTVRADSWKGKICARLA